VTFSFVTLIEFELVSPKVTHTFENSSQGSQIRRNAVVKFDMYQNLQQHCVVLPMIAWLSCSLYSVFNAC